MGLLYVRAGCLTAENAGFRPGQFVAGGGAGAFGPYPPGLEGEDAPETARLREALDRDLQATQVRTTPCRPRSWANFSLLYLYSHGNARASSHISGQPNTFLATAQGLQEGRG
jgi:hypothetical protein